MNKLKEWIYERNLTIRDFAAQIGVSYKHLGLVCNGHKQPGESLALRISRITNDDVPMSYWKISDRSSIAKKKFKRIKRTTKV